MYVCIGFTSCILLLIQYYVDILSYVMLLILVQSFLQITDSSLSGL